MNEIKILLIVKADFLQGILKFILESYFVCDVHAMADEQKALDLLKEKNHGFHFIIYDYDPFSYFLDDLKKNVHIRSSTQTFVLSQAEHEQNVKLFEKETGIKLLKKDEIPLGLIREICSKNSSPEVLNNSSYCRIPVKLLVRFDGIKKNLYLKLGKDKMIQIFKEDDKTDLEDILNYHRKGVDFLYLKRSTAEAIATQVQRQIKVFLKSNNFKFVLKSATDSTESLFEQRIIRINQELFIDDEFQKIIMESINKMKSKIMKEKRIDLFMSHLMNMPNHFNFFSRKVELTSMFAVLFVEKLKWSSQGTTEKIIYASVLSDITLAVRPKLLQIRDIDEFNACKDDLSQEEKDFFLSHPHECGALASKFFQTAPTDTSVLIQQHHELPDGRGFPAALKAEKISPLSAAFIIANDLAHYILSSEEPTIDEYLEENRVRWDYVNFRKIIRAIEEMKDQKLKYLSK